MEPYYYSVATEQRYSAYQMQTLFGIDVETTNIEILNQNGFYPVVFREPDFDTKLYQPTVSYVIVGTDAVQTYTPTPLPLSTAKTNAIAELTARCVEANDQIQIESGFDAVSLAAIASQGGSIPVSFQTLFNNLTANTDQLNSDIVAVNACTTVDDINNIVNPPD